VYDSGGELIWADDDSGGGYNAAIVGMPVSEGETYEIRAQSYDEASGGEYIISLTVAPPPQEVVEINFGDTLANDLEPGREIQFVFEGRQGDHVRVRVTGAFDSYLILRDQRGVIIAQDDDSGGDYQPLLSNVELPEDG